jgi:hypothetical protein
MNFELAEELNQLLIADKLEYAIKLTEDKLEQEGPTDFKIILGKNLLHLTESLTSYLDSFYKKTKNNIKVRAMYCEMNGFTINNDLWYLDAFAYDKFEGLDDLDWLADWEGENSTKERFVLTGFEDLQNVYEDYMEKENWKDEKIQSSANICELLIILRLQELLKATVTKGKEKKMEWALIPILVTAHDNELIYRAA